MLLVVVLSVVMLVVALFYVYAECRYAWCRGDLRVSHYIGRLHANIRFSQKKLFSDKRSSLIFRSVFDEEKKSFLKPLLGHGKILLSLFFLFS